MSSPGPHSSPTVCRVRKKEKDSFFPHLFQKSKKGRPGVFLKTIPPSAWPASPISLPLHGVSLTFLDVLFTLKPPYEDASDSHVVMS